MKQSARQVLKEYMLHVYKWTGNFECDEGGDNVLYSKLFKQLETEILFELANKNLSENIIDKNIVVQ